MAYKVGRCLLHDRLHDAGISPVQLSDRLDMPLSQISDYTSGRKTMSLRNAKSIAAVVNCHIDDLYEWIPIDSSKRKRSKQRKE